MRLYLLLSHLWRGGHLQRMPKFFPPLHSSGPSTTYFCCMPRHNMPQHAPSACGGPIPILWRRAVHTHRTHSPSYFHYQQLSSAYSCCIPLRRQRGKQSFFFSYSETASLTPCRVSGPAQGVPVFATLGSTPKCPLPGGHPGSQGPATRRRRLPTGTPRES